ncbi:MAG: insulinase family protein [bacterium]|nr:insulinase family protein [bacterium]
MKSRLVFFCAALFFVLSISTAFGFDFSELEGAVSERTLDNGLKIIVMERHDAPVASFVTWANVGGVDDPKGYTGLAHMFEHMAFKGTEMLGSTDIEKEKELIAVEDSVFLELRAERNKGRMADSARIAILEEAYDAARDASFELVVPNAYGETIDREGGVGLNAFTAADMTVYFYSLPSNKVELWMALESERFFKPVLREMYKERDVVAEERRMTYESRPFGRAFEELRCMSFKAHPYGVPGIGHMSDIQYYSREGAQAFFDKYYVPSNLVVAVVGDVKPKEVFRLAEEYWGRIPYRPAPEKIATVEPEQQGERRMVMEDPSQPLYLVSYHVPDAQHPDNPAIDAFMDYLCGGRTSVLYKSMIKEKKNALMIQGSADFLAGKYPSIAVMITMPAQGHTNLECEQDIFEGIKFLQENVIPDEDVEEIKARAKAAFIAGGGFGGGLNSNIGLAMQLAAFETDTGNWRNLFTELDRINAVTAEDIQRVAKEYFTEDNRNVVMMNNAES